MRVENNVEKSNVVRFIIEIIISFVNVAMIVIIASTCVYKLQIPFLIISMIFVYIVAFSAFSYQIIEKYRKVGENVLERMTYSTRCMFLSQIIFVFEYKILCTIANAVSKVLVASVGFAIWLVIGNKSTIGEGIKEFIASLKVSGIIVDAYNTVSTWIEQVLIHFFNFELKIVNKTMVKEQSGDNAEDGRNTTVDPDEYAEVSREKYVQNIEKAKNGDAKAQVIVAKYCLNYGSQEDAVKWLIRAASSDEASAYTELGYCYMNGIGVGADSGKAINLYKKAARMQDVDAMRFLADYFIAKSNKQETITASIKLYAKAAGMGDVYAQGRLGVIYYEGKYINKNESQAYFWLKKSVEENGDYYFGYYLAKCYLDGIGTEVDSKKGFGILKRTVEKNGSHFTDCLKLLSLCYRKGIGVSKNAYLARIYMQKANQQDQLVSDILNGI